MAGRAPRLSRDRARVSREHRSVGAQVPALVGRLLGFAERLLRAVLQSAAPDAFLAALSAAESGREQAVRNRAPYRQQLHDLSGAIGDTGARRPDAVGTLAV